MFNFRFIQYPPLIKICVPVVSRDNALIVLLQLSINELLMMLNNPLFPVGIDATCVSGNL